MWLRWPRIAKTEVPKRSAIRSCGSALRIAFSISLRLSWPQILQGLDIFDHRFLPRRCLSMIPWRGRPRVPPREQFLRIQRMARLRGVPVSLNTRSGTRRSALPPSCLRGLTRSRQRAACTRPRARGWSSPSRARARRLAAPPARREGDERREQAGDGRAYGDGRDPGDARCPLGRGSDKHAELIRAGEDLQRPRDDVRLERGPP